jgi:hypothetical protein
MTLGVGQAGRRAARVETFRQRHEYDDDLLRPLPEIVTSLGGRLVPLAGQIEREIAAVYMSPADRVGIIGDASRVTRTETATPCRGLRRGLAAADAREEEEEEQGPHRASSRFPCMMRPWYTGSPVCEVSSQIPVSVPAPTYLRIASRAGAGISSMEAGASFLFSSSAWTVTTLETAGAANAADSSQRHLAMRSPAPNERQATHQGRMALTPVRFDSPQPSLTRRRRGRRRRRWRMSRHVT